MALRENAWRHDAAAGTDNDQQPPRWRCQTHPTASVARRPTSQPTRRTTTTRMVAMLVQTPGRVVTALPPQQQPCASALPFRGPAMCSRCWCRQSYRWRASPPWPIRHRPGIFVARFRLRCVGESEILCKIYEKEYQVFAMHIVSQRRKQVENNRTQLFL